MTPDTIEKDSLVSVPAGTVYRVITKPAQIARWFADAADLDPVPGGQDSLTFADRAISQQMSVSLAAEGAGTRPRVTESGFAALRKPDAEKAGYYEAHAEGWDAHLASLQSHVAGQS